MTLKDTSYIVSPAAKLAIPREDPEPLRSPTPRNLSTTMGHSTGLIREQCPVW